VRDLPPGAEPAGTLVAGRLAFGESALHRSLRLTDARGSSYDLRPEGETFAAALAPGRYAVVSFGGYRPIHDRPTVEIAASRANYLGTLQPARSEDGDLLVLVKDGRAEVEAALRARYGASFPALAPALVRSPLEPAPGTSGELAIAVERPPPPPPSYASHGLWWFHRLPCRPYARGRR